MHRIIRLTFVQNHQLTRTTVYQADGTSIVAFQLEQREQSYIERDDFHYLFLIESNNKFKRVLCTGDQESNHFTCDLNIDFSFHPGLTDLLLKSQQ